MIDAVHATAIDPRAGMPAPAAALRRFARGVRWRHVRGRALGTALRTLLLLSVPAVLVAWWLPTARGDVALIATAILLPMVFVSVLRAWWQGRRILSALGESLQSEGTSLSAVHDELATWLEFDRDHTASARRGVDAGMLRWLERDVVTRLAPHQQRALAAVARPRVGRFRWLLPLLILLLVLWFLSWWLAPPWPGALGGRANQPTQGQGENGQGGGGASIGNQQGEQPGEQPDEQEPGEARADPLPPPTPSTMPEPQPVEPEPPAPLLDLPDQQRFVVPDFIGDGPTRRARVRAAELDEQVGGAAPAPAPTPATGNNEVQPEPPQPDEFERAAEAALRARHVPPAERAMVRRFFELLQQAKR